VVDNVCAIFVGEPVLALAPETFDWLLTVHAKVELTTFELNKISVVFPEQIVASFAERIGFGFTVTFTILFALTQPLAVATTAYLTAPAEVVVELF
jgi:hypothetical protein